MRAKSQSILHPTTTAVAGIVTAQVVSQEFAITPMGMCAIRIDAKVSGVVSTGTVTLTFQTGNSVLGWVTAKAASEITADGVKSILMLDTVAADQAVMPLAALGRLVLTTTHADDAVTFDAILVTQGQ